MDSSSRLPKYQKTSASGNTRMVDQHISSRQRLRPWLIKQLDENLIKGLQWLDGDRSSFRIPWKHGGKQDYTQEEGKVFEMWAVYSGKYRPNIDEREPARWKTNLRCALNKAKDIEEIKELTNKEDSNPFKVYKFHPLSKGPKRKCDFDPLKHESSDEAIPESVAQQKQSASSYASSSLSKSGSIPLHIPPKFGRLSDDQSMDCGDIEPDGLVGPDSTTTDHPCGRLFPYTSSYHPPSNDPPPPAANAPIPTLIEGECHSTSMGTDEFLPPGQYVSAQVFHDADMRNPIQESFPQPAAAAAATHSEIPVEEFRKIVLAESDGFDYQLSYLDQLVEIRRLYGKNHISYGDSTVPDIFHDTLLGASNSHKVPMPHVPIDLANNVHVQDVLELLNSCKRGFIMTCLNGDLYLRRNSKVSIFFWNGTKTVKVARDQQDVKIFDYMSFCKSVEKGLRPDTEVQVYIGQNGEPQKVKKLYIVVKVKSVLAEQLLTKAIDISEPSIEKEISHSMQDDTLFDEISSPGGLAMQL